MPDEVNNPYKAELAKAQRRLSDARNHLAMNLQKRDDECRPATELVSALVSIATHEGRVFALARLAEAVDAEASDRDVRRMCLSMLLDVPNDTYSGRGYNDMERARVDGIKDVVRDVRNGSL